MPEHNQIQHRKMTEGSVPLLLFRLSLPTTAATLLQSVYSLADAVFVSRLGTSASGAVGISFCIISLIQAIGFTLGTGAGSLLSRRLGAKKQEEADLCASLAFWLSLLFGVLVTLAGLVRPDALIRFLGATETILPYARSYAIPLLAAAPVTCGAFVLNNLLRAEGKVVYAMVGLGTGCVLNAALDPLLMFSFGLGVWGAALATLISQSIAFLILLSAYLFRKSTVSLSLRHALKHPLGCGQIFLTGIPSLFRQGLAGVAALLINRAAGTWGDAAIAAFSVTSRVFLFLYGFCLGIGQGMMPAAGYNRGYGKDLRVRKIYLFAVLYASLVMLALALPTGIFAPRVIAWFRPDPEVIRIGTVILRAHCAVAVLHGVVTCTNMLLQGIGKPIPAALIACARQGLFFLPAVFLLPRLWGLSGLEWTQAVADVLTFLFTLPFAVRLIKGLRKKDETK